MSELQSLKERRLAVQSTQKITKAMKMIAVARLRGAQQRNDKAKPYNDHVNTIVHTAARQSPQAFDRYLHGNETGNDLYILIAANRGLCGSYNQNTFRLMESLIEGQRLENPEENTLEMITLGKKANEFVGRFEDIQHVGDFMLGDTPSFIQIEAVAARVLALFKENTYRMIRCVGTRFQSVLVQESVITPIFPLVIPHASQAPEARHEDPSRVISMEPNPSESAAHLWHLYVRSKLYQCLVESVTSEHASRMRAMDSASRNAENMIDELTLLYNRKRQAEITSELTEIIAGSESMKGEN